MTLAKEHSSGEEGNAGKRPARGSSGSTEGAGIPQRVRGVDATPAAVLADSVRTEFAARFRGLLEAAPERLSREDVPESLHGIAKLAEDGQWGEVAALATALLDPRVTRSPPLLPHEMIELSLCLATACLRLKRYRQGLTHIASLDPLLPSTQRYQYESYPEIYPGRTGSFLPLSLRVVHGLILHYCDQNDQALALLHSLLAEHSSAVPSENSPDPPPPVSDTPETHDRTRSAEMVIDPLLNAARMAAMPYTPFPPPHRPNTREEWVRQQCVISSALVEVHVRLSQTRAAHEVMERLLKTHGQEPAVLHRAARFSLQYGSVQTARELFARSEKLSQHPPSKISIDTHLNRGFLAMATGDYSAALDEFELVSEYVPHHVEAGTNRAIALLHLCRLEEATTALEDLLLVAPRPATRSEATLLNLAALYDLQSDKVAGKKEVLLELVRRYGPDTFDEKVLRVRPE